MCSLSQAAAKSAVTDLWAILEALSGPYWPEAEQFFGPIILFGGILLGAVIGILEGSGRNS
jgi:hypothetical protein